MLLFIMTSCNPHIVYKTKTEYITAPDDLLVECEAVAVKAGATTKEELLPLVMVAYVDTLKNVSACNIKTKAAKEYIKKVKNESISSKE